MQLTCSGLYLALDRLWQHSDLARIVPSFLILSHHIVRASVPLMEVARDRALSAAGSDPVCAGLADYLSGHLEEERGHDDWLLDDLESIGCSRAGVLAATPSPEVASLVGAQYYWIQHHHPIGLLGYIAVLEGNPPSEEHVARIRRLTGLPDSLFRTYRLHGQVDGDHRADLDRTLDRLTVTGTQRALIGLSAAFTASRLAECLDQLEPIDALLGGQHGD
jgi:hypothetical protein